jgi:hypothetical protein
MISKPTRAVLKKKKIVKSAPQRNGNHPLNFKIVATEPVLLSLSKLKTLRLAQ